jgi:hypothetical protein
MPTTPYRTSLDLSICTLSIVRAIIRTLCHTVSNAVHSKALFMCAVYLALVLLVRAIDIDMLSMPAIISGKCVDFGLTTVLPK